MFSTLQKRYTLIIIMVTTISLSLLLFLNYFLLRSHSIESARDTSEMIISNVEAQINLLFSSVESTLTALSRYESVRSVEEEEMKNQFISHVQANNEIIRAIYLGTVDGKMYEWGMGPGFIDYTPTFPEGYDPRVRPWYRTGLESDTFALSSPYLYASTEALGITAVMKVYDEERLVGVLGLDIILNGLNNLVDLIEIGEGGRIILLTGEGDELANQFPSVRQDRTILTPFPYLNILKEHSPASHEIYGERYMVHYKESAQTGWTILIALPYRQILAFSLKQMQIIIFYDILIMLLLGSIVTYISKRILTDPIHEIIGVLKKHESGDFQARIRDQATEEFQMIAETFNTVSENKLEQDKRMEAQVVERTQEVLSLQKENVRLRIIEEKERIYSTLHDSLGARLTSINISNNVARHAIDISDVEKVRQMLDRIEYNTAKGITDLKEILDAKEEYRIPKGYITHFFSLHLARRLSVRGIGFSYTLPPPEELEHIRDDILLSFTLMLEELVTNTLKYSQAHTVEIRLELKGKAVTLFYSDDGIGFDTRKAQKQGFGIPGIFRRAEHLNGYVKVYSKPKKGVRYDIHVPAEEQV